MSEFQPKTITTKESKECLQCGAVHHTGAKVLMSFARNRSGVVAHVLCDGDCLAEWREARKEPLNRFLDQLSTQFN